MLPTMSVVSLDEKLSKDYFDKRKMWERKRGVMNHFMLVNKTFF